MDTLRVIVLAVFFLSAATGHNITDILSEFPEYSVFSNYLTQTKLDDEINSRQTITVLVLNSSVVSEFVANQPLSVVKTALSIHVLLDYFDMKKLMAIGGGTMISTTLYQTTGNAAGGTGFVNITNLKGGKVGFGSAAPGSKLDSLYAKSVKQIPYNISVLEIDSPIIAPGILTGRAPSGVNMSSLLERAGCRTFAKLIMDTGVLKVYETVAAKGLTVFAPSDGAFMAPGLPNLNKLTNAELVSLLLYHAISSYIPRGTLKTEKDPINTLATNGAGRFDLTVRIAGDSITLDSGLDSARVANIVFDSVPLCIFAVENVLLPTELFTKAPSPVPAPAPQTPTPSAHAPPHAPISSSTEPASATSPYLSPPAPPTPPTSPPTSGPAPADGPTADSGNSNASNTGEVVKAPAFFLALVMLSISGIISSIVA